MTYNLLLILIMIVAVLLILIVLVQNPKGGGLSSSIAGGTGNTIGGVQNTNQFLDKATWTLAIAMIALILFSAFLIPSAQNTTSELQNTIENRQKPNDKAGDLDNLINPDNAPAPTAPASK